MSSIPIVNDRDKRWGIITSGIVMLLVVIYMLMFYFIIPDPPPVNPPLRADAEIEDIVLEELQVEAGGAGAAGAASDDPVKPPQPQVENVLTNPESPVETNSGSSNQTNTTKPTDNTASTTTTGTSPFGGNNSGNNSGSGTGTFGSDTGKEGSGGGPSTASGAGRVRYNEISTDEIYTSSTVIVKLILTIDAEGRVVDARCLTSQTTTTDQRIINQVIYAARTQLKYNPEPGAGLQSVYYTAKIVPN